MGFFGRLFARKRGGTRVGNYLRRRRNRVFFGLFKRRNRR